MDIKFIDTDKIYPFLMIDNFYTEEEQELIWTELEFLRGNLERADTATAVDKDGLRLAAKWSVFLDDVFKDRQFSNVFRFKGKMFNEEVLEAYNKIPSYQTYVNCNQDNTLLNYYEDGDYYKPHYDAMHHSCIVWFIREPKVWKGGEFLFEDSKIEIECKHNRMVLFPSFYLHGARAVKMKKKDKNKGLGRYAMSTFLDIFHEYPSFLKESKQV